MNSHELTSLPARSPEHAGSEGGVATAAPTTGFLFTFPHLMLDYFAVYPVYCRNISIHIWLINLLLGRKIAWVWLLFGNLNSKVLSQWNTGNNHVLLFREDWSQKGYLGIRRWVQTLCQKLTVEHRTMLQCAITDVSMSWPVSYINNYCNFHHGAALEQYMFYQHREVYPGGQERILCFVPTSYSVFLRQKFSWNPEKDRPSLCPPSPVA